MFDLTASISQGGANPALLVAAALLLGALHGFEPGHSKTMMAAFIIAVRGTPGQAALLGLSAAVSHSAIVWILALVALRYGEGLVGAELEPWFMVASGAVILLIALWIFVQARRTERTHHHGPGHEHEHGQGHGHSHDHDHHHDHGDSHARTHAAEIEARFAGSGRATGLQTVMFGLTGGLIPCSAAVTVLILCLHLDRFWLGMGLVGAFSAGLAAALVAVGVAAALGTRYVAARSGRFEGLFRRAPYLSAAIIAVLGGAMVASGWAHLPAAG